MKGTKHANTRKEPNCSLIYPKKAAHPCDRTIASNCNEEFNFMFKNGFNEFPFFISLNRAQSCQLHITFWASRSNEPYSVQSNECRYFTRYFRKFTMMQTSRLLNFESGLKKGTRQEIRSPNILSSQRISSASLRLYKHSN